MVTSIAVSRGRQEPLVGKILLDVGLRVCFTGIQSLFTIILLVHKIIILFCIWCGVHWELCERLVLFCYHPKKGKPRKMRLNALRHRRHAN